MADAARTKYDGYSVVDAPTDSAPSGKKGRTKYDGFQVVDSEQKYKENVMDAYVDGLDASHFKNETAADGVIDWIGDASRATIIGSLADPIAALYLSHKFKDKGVSYKNAMQVIKKRHEATPHLTATLTGAVLGGGAIANGLKRGAQWGATKSGMVDGAMKWAAKDKIVNRTVGAMATGAAAGMVEEGVRASLEETFDATAGLGFDGNRVVENTLVGGLIGGLATPMLQEGLNGGKWLINWTRKALGNDALQSNQAAKEIMRAFADEGEDLGEAFVRFQEKVQTFTMKNGRPPAAADIMAPEQVAKVSEVIRSYSGLDQTARKLGKKGVERALNDYDRQVSRGVTTRAPEEIDAFMSDLFNDVMYRNGNVMVDVPDEAVTSLSRNRDWINQRAAAGNDGAVSIGRVLDAKANVNGLRDKVARMRSGVNKADAEQELAEIGEDIQRLIDDARQEGSRAGDIAGMEAPGIGDLRHLRNVRSAIAKRRAKTDQAGFKTDDLQSTEQLLTQAETALENYSRNGMKVKLSDVNNLRATASRHFNTHSGIDPDKADLARSARDAIAPIGTKEVEEYGDVVKRWNLENNRIEAHKTGQEAAFGDVDLATLDARLDQGRLPNRPAASTDAQRRAIRFGAQEGARRALKKEITGPTMEGVAGAARVATSPRAQTGIQKAIGGNQSKDIIESAKQVVDSYNSMAALSKPSSASELAEDRQIAADILTGSVFSNLGGAGRAHWLTRLFMRFQVPRGQAKKMVEMLGDPDSMDAALAFAQKKGIRVGPLFSIALNRLTDPASENED